MKAILAILLLVSSHAAATLADMTPGNYRTTQRLLYHESRIIWKTMKHPVQPEKSGYPYETLRTKQLTRPSSLGAYGAT